MRRFLFAVLLLFFIGGIFLMSPEKKTPAGANPYLPLYRIMELAEAEVVEGELHYWASLGAGSGFSSPRQLEKKAEQLLRCITAVPGADHNSDPQNETLKSPTPAGGRCSEKLSAKVSDARASDMLAEKMGHLGTGATVRLLLQEMEEENLNVAHLLVTITEQGQAKQLGTYACSVPTLLKPEIEDGSLSLCLTGHIEKQLTEKEMEALALNITSALGGRQVQSVKDGAMVSVTGYTPDLGDFLRAENLRINLNLALSYDEYLGKTVIRAGSPLIARWY